MSYTFFRNMSIAGRLKFILDNPNLSNGRGGNNRERNPFLTEALAYAAELLPEGRSKRALDYVARNPGAEFHFNGKDAVKPASIETLQLLEKHNVA